MKKSAAKKKLHVSRKSREKNASKYEAVERALLPLHNERNFPREGF